MVVSDLTSGSLWRIGGVSYIVQGCDHIKTQGIHSGNIGVVAAAVAVVVMFSLHQKPFHQLKNEHHLGTPAGKYTTCAVIGLPIHNVTTPYGIVRLTSKHQAILSLLPRAKKKRPTPQELLTLRPFLVLWKDFFLL